MFFFRMIFGISLRRLGLAELVKHIEQFTQIFWQCSLSESASNCPIRESYTTCFLKLMIDSRQNLFPRHHRYPATCLGPPALEFSE
ncbi:hypothetical protein RSP799_22915 [Ralstonia solanacearum]|nr:hypothetical protein RSP799_22915 [Ralstonia solanacearum]